MSKKPQKRPEKNVVRCISCRREISAQNQNGTCGAKNCEAHAISATKWAKAVCDRALAHYPKGYFDRTAAEPKDANPFAPIHNRTT